VSGLSQKVVSETEGEDNLGVLRDAARRITKFYNAYLEPSGLTATQLFLLLKIRDLREASVIEIAAKMGVNRTTIARCMNGLKASEFIRVKKSVKDGRALSLVITGKGTRALEIASPLWRRAQTAFDQLNGPEAGRVLRATLGGLNLEEFPVANDRD
jgi:DNA-binding MarR family transcriptional regulator